jgi:hypothetical protein
MQPEEHPKEEQLLALELRGMELHQATLEIFRLSK